MSLQQSVSPGLQDIRQAIRNNYLADEYEVIHQLIEQAQLSDETRKAISARAADLVRDVRDNAKPTIMEKFLAEYGLTTKEGVALMCLAEALLRVPDNLTIQDLIEDKITSGNWGAHVGKAKSGLINSATLALLMTSNLLKDSERQSVGDTLRKMVKRLGEPVVRTAAGQAMKEMGRQFVLGRTIEEAQDRGKSQEEQGYTVPMARHKRPVPMPMPSVTSTPIPMPSTDQQAVRRRCAHQSRYFRKTVALLARYEYGQGNGDRAGPPRPDPRQKSRRGQYGLQHRCRRAGPPGPVSGRDRSYPLRRRTQRLGRLWRGGPGLRQAGFPDP